MKRRFVLTPEAKADLREILLDIAEDSPDTAERLRFEFYQGLQRLGRSPGIGHYRQALLDWSYRFLELLLLRRMLLMGTHADSIVAVVHGSRHLASFFSARLSSE